MQARQQTRNSSTKSSQNAPKTVNKIPKTHNIKPFRTTFTTMKKILVILLVMQIFSGNVILPELAKIPQLIEHFRQHQRENNALDFFSFLKMHYADPEHQQKDASRHGSLPLKSVSLAHAEVIVLHETAPSVYEVEKADFAQKLLLPTSKNLLFDSKIRFSIFQPPRI